MRRAIFFYFRIISQHVLLAAFADQLRCLGAMLESLMPPIILAISSATTLDAPGT